MSKTFMWIKTCLYYSINWLVNLKVHSSLHCARSWVCLSVGHPKTLEPRRLSRAATRLLYLLSEMNIPPIGRNLRKIWGWTDRECREMSLFLEDYYSWVSVECKWAVIIGTAWGSCFISFEYKHTADKQFQRLLLYCKSRILSVLGLQSHSLRMCYVKR